MTLLNPWLPVALLALTQGLAGCVSAPEAQGPAPQSLSAELHPGPAPKAPDHCIGALQDGATYRWFSALCHDDLTSDMTTMLQRALAARGIYTATPNGRYDTRTEAAVLAYQSARDLPSPTLSTRAAQQMGLIPWLD
ncbi:MAG TPA: peptidoglycan-binding domain-containing protein [Paenirhodobacter sp.]